MKAYGDLFRFSQKQLPESIFAHFYPLKRDVDSPDYDEPWRAIAQDSLDGYDSWTFQQERFRMKHSYSAVPKLKNYLNYTFVRLVTLEQEAPENHFFLTADQEWTCFNTGLQNSFGADLLAIFQRYKPRSTPRYPQEVRPDWVYKGCHPPIMGNIVSCSECGFRRLHGTQRTVEISFLILHMDSTKKRSTISLNELSSGRVCLMLQMKSYGII